MGKIKPILKSVLKPILVALDFIMWNLLMSNTHGKVTWGECVEDFDDRWEG